jgi:hypothetical protein
MLHALHRLETTHTLALQRFSSVARAMACFNSATEARGLVSAMACFSSATEARGSVSAMACFSSGVPRPQDHETNLKQ